MKSTLAFLSLIVLGTAAGAAQLPNSTLYIKPTTLDRKMMKADDSQPGTFTAYVAYTEDPSTPTTDGGPFGSGIEAMTEDVAAQLKGMTIDHAYKCDAHVMKSIRQFQVFQLNNCK